VALLLEKFATMMESQRGGCLAAISSVAGDRGRQSNYIYGAAKAGLSTFLDGLRNRMFRVGVHVLSIKPGFVDTPMTLGKINPRSPLVASPDRVARDIDRALLRRENVLYTPWFWWPIMKVIRLVPEPIFKRLGL
jgi:short-subunit dehydrogenase